MGDQFDILRKEILTGQIIVPGDDEYNESIKRWSDTCIKPAAVVVKVTSADEASTTVKFATANKIPLVVRGGGHSSSASSASDGGMVIDLSLMRSVTVDTQRKTATCGGGALWEDVNKAAWEPHRLATVGGAVDNTGVGGLTLGGGYGWLSGKYGLACDNLVEVEVVLADGSIVLASATENPDLFWALRGVGMCFGVCTKFTAQLYDQGHVWAGPLVIPYDCLPAVVDFANWHHGNQADGDANFLFAPTWAPDGNAKVVLGMLFYNGAKEDGERFFAPLIKLAMANMTRVMPYPDVNTLFNEVMNQPGRKLQGGSNFVLPLTAAQIEDVMELYLPFVKEHGIAADCFFTYEIFSNVRIRSVGVSGTAHALRDNVYHATISWLWKDPVLDTVIRAFNRKVVQKLKENGVKNGALQYNNHSDEILLPEEAFGANVQRLQQLKTKYDPNNVFWKWHGIFPRT